LFYLNRVINNGDMAMNFPYPLIILRHWRDLETQQERKKGICTRFEWWETI
jgi:hypothetical protein